MTSLRSKCNAIRPMAARFVVVIALMATVACNRATPVSPDAPLNTASLPETDVVVPGMSDGVPKSKCLFSSSNPYPCCANVVGKEYGNCTGGAWEQAKKNWGHELNAWGSPPAWKKNALADGFLIDADPTEGSIGISTSISTNGHVAYVAGVGQNRLNTIEQQCGVGYRGGWLYINTRSASDFNVGYIRAPLPKATILAWSGAASTTGGTLTVKRNASVSFGFSHLRSNFNKGTTKFKWTISGTSASTAGTFSSTFPKSGSFPIKVVVTNGLGLTTTAAATVVVK